MDLRVPLDAIAGAFGAQATVTRPWDTPVPASIVWLRPLPDTPGGRDYARRGPRWLMAVRRDEVQELERGSIIRVSGPPGEAEKNWQVDGMELVDQEFFYAIIIPKTVGA